MRAADSRYRIEFFRRKKSSAFEKLPPKNPSFEERKKNIPCRYTRNLAPWGDRISLNVLDKF